MKLDRMLRALHRSEHRMVSSLLGTADRHVVDHEVHHVAKDLARWSQQHVHELAEVGRQRGINLADNAPADAGMFGRLEQKASELTGVRPEPALLLLADLRRLHLKAVGVAADWELLTQGALATRDDELLAVAGRCRPQTLRQAKWARSMLKILSPQTLAT